MNTRKNKFFEFLTLLTTIVGIVIGTGEFVKNDNWSEGHVLYSTNNNAIMAMTVWFIIGIACIFMMLVFMEVASATSKHGNGTTSSWLKIFASRRLASFVSLFWIFLYVPVFYSFFSIATTEYIFVSFNITAVYSTKFILIYYFVGLFVLIFFTMMNTFVYVFGKYLQIFGTALKIIPFVLILILGFIPALNNSGGSNAFDDPNNHLWKASNFFLATGPILFSFDGFIFATNLQKETKHKHLISISLFTGIIIIVIIYILEAFALFFGTKDGSVMTLFQNSFGSKIAELIDLLIVFAILISMNGNSLVGARYIITDTNAKLLYSNNKKISLNKSGTIQMLIGLVWFIILLTLGIFVNKGMYKSGDTLEFEPYHFSDLMSNAVVMIAFLIYILIMIFAVINRIRKKIETIKIKGMPIYAIISILILVPSILYSFYLIIISKDITKYLILMSVIINLILFSMNEFVLQKKRNN